MVAMSHVEFVKTRKRGRVRRWEVDTMINLPMHGRLDLNDHRCSKNTRKTVSCGLTSSLQAAGARYGFKVQTVHGLGMEFFSIKLPITAILRD